MIVRVVAVMVALLGCGDNASAPVDAMPDAAPCPLGDISQPIELGLGYFHPTDKSFVPLSEMMPVPIVFAVQGNWVARIGVRARNLDCRMTMTTALFDTCPGDKLLKSEQRPVKLEAQPDGWGLPLNVSYYSSLHACPLAGQVRHVNDVPYQIKVVVEDSMGKTVETSLHVVPYCIDGDDKSDCECRCNRDYVLGGACPPVSSGEPPVCAP